MHKSSILILGLFESKTAKINIRTAEDRVAEMFRKNNVHVITASHASGRIKRLSDSIYAVIKYRKQYNVAIIPLFGTWPSFLWQEVVTRFLKALNKKIVLGIHGGSIPGRINKGSQRFYKALKRADRLVAPSAYFQLFFQQKNFEVLVIENPLDLSAYHFMQKKKIRPRIIWMRAFTEIYNPAMALRVAARMAERFHDFEMVMAGKDGPLRNEMIRITESSGLKDKVIFPGYISMQQKLEMAAEYDIYICTNKTDNAPVSVIEFMSLGLPVVAVNTGGIPFIVNDTETGLLVDDDDDKAMFEKICLLIENENIAQSIITKAYQYAKQYDEANVMHKWNTVLDELK